MALSRLARQFAAEIKNHDWSDAPYRIDRAGHRREDDSPARLTDDVLGPRESDNLKLNVVWVTAQVLAFDDPNFDVHEFAAACDVEGFAKGTIHYGLRREPDGSPSSALLDDEARSLDDPELEAFWRAMPAKRRALLERIREEEHARLSKRYGKA